MPAAHVQHVVTRQFGGTSIAAVLTGVAAGAALAASIRWSNTGITLTSVTVSGNSDMALRNNPTTGFGSRAALAYLLNANAGDLTVTANFSAEVGNWEVLMVHEASGVATSGALDGSTIQQQSDPGLGTDAVSSGAIVTTAAGDYIAGFCQTDGEGGATASAGTGYTLRLQGAAIDYASETKIQSAAGSIAATFTQDQAFADFLAGIIALQAVEAAGPAARAILAMRVPLTA